MNIRPSAAIRQNYNEIAVPCRGTLREKMLALREQLLIVEEDRVAGRNGCTVDELDSYLDAILNEG